MITLLLVLFIVLFAISKVDQAKFREFKQSVSRAVLSHTPQGTTKAHTDVTHQVAAGQSARGHQRRSSPRRSMHRGCWATSPCPSTRRDWSRGSSPTPRSSRPTRPSSRRSAIRSSTRRRGVLKNYPNAIEVAGYTDNQPITGGPYANNWELSAARATTVVMRMTGSDGVNPGQVVLLGYGQYHPLGSQHLAGGAGAKSEGQHRDQSLQPSSCRDRPEPSGEHVMSQPTKTVRSHDFRRTDLLERVSLQAIDGLLETFARSATQHLTSVLRQQCSFTLDKLDQVTWRDLAEELRERDLLLHVLAVPPGRARRAGHPDRRGAGDRGSPPRRRRRRRFLRPGPQRDRPGVPGPDRRGPHR